MRSNSDSHLHSSVPSKFAGVLGARIP